MPYRRYPRTRTVRNGRRGPWKPPSSAAARRIVRRAGPMEKAFFINSTLLNYGNTPPTVYAGDTNIHSQRYHELYGPNDYDQNGGESRERLKVNRALVTMNYFAPRNLTDGSYPEMTSHVFALLVASNEGDMATWFDEGVNDANPYGAQTSTAFYESLERGIRVLTRAYWRIPHRLVATVGGPANGGEDPIGINLSRGQQMPHTGIRRLTAKNFWLREPEALYLVTGRIVLKSQAQTANEIDTWFGYHTVQVSSSRY